MTDIELIELTKAYVALSNAHRIDLIMQMFAAGARYTTTTGGVFRGRAAIADMTQGYFRRYPNAHLHTSNYQCADNSVSFDFTMKANDVDSGEEIEHSGNEQFEFTADGSIKKITVETS